MEQNESSKDRIKNFEIERNLLAGLIKFPESLYDFEQFLTQQDFYFKAAGQVYSVLHYLIIEKDVKRLDSAIILATVSNMVLSFPPGIKITDYINNLINNNTIEFSTIKLLAKEVILMSKRREMWECGNKLQRNMLDGHKFGTIQEVIGVTDEIYFDAIKNFVVEDEMVQAGDGLAERMNKLADAPIERLGFSSGYEKWDKMIGFLRRDMLAFVSARPKIGKSMFGMNIGWHVANKENIPVLYLDSEMTKPEWQDRLLSHASRVDIDYIETGAWARIQDYCPNVQAAISSINKGNMTYISIRSMNIAQILSTCRRFLFKKVKRNSDGQFNPCLFVYDYLKLDYSANLGDSYHLNLAKSVVNFKDFLGSTLTTGLVLGQQNRSGITKTDPKTGKSVVIDTEEIIAGTDEISKSSSNISSLRQKISDEVIADGEKHGDFLLMPFLARQGSGGQWMQQTDGKFCRDYVNFQRNAKQMSFDQLDTKRDILRAQDISHAFVKP